MGISCEPPITPIYLGLTEKPGYILKQAGKEQKA